jgi:hypothetical protein
VPSILTENAISDSVITTGGGFGVGGVGVGVSPPLLHPEKDSTIKLSAIMLLAFKNLGSCCINYNLTILN